VIEYKTEKGLLNSLKNNSVCRKCAASGENNGMYGKIAELNPFFGKHHSKETIDKLKIVDKSYTKTQEFRDKISQLNNDKIIGTHGKPNYDGWVYKFGKEVADEKLKSVKAKLSILNSGSGNPMFGKPSPKGSGNGWSGWYKGWYFRSLRELTYMIKIIERFNLKWVSGESKKYKISYQDFKGSDRNYFPDFIINGKYIVECKPKKLWTSDNVIRKKNAAIEYCLRNDLIYKMVDIGKISDEEIKTLKENGFIIFLPRYEKKYKEMFGN
jgi:hypothetical protein